MRSRAWTILAAVWTTAVLASSAEASPGDLPQAPGVWGPSILLHSAEPYAGHGTTGDKAVIFNVEFQPPDIMGKTTGVYVYDRLTKSRVGELPPVGLPEWTFPMNIQVESFTGNAHSSQGTVLVLEVGLNEHRGTDFIQLIRYSYSYSVCQGFQVQVEDVGQLPVITSGPTELPNGFALPVPLTIAPAADGTPYILVADAMVGAVWATPASDLGQWQMVLLAPEIGSTPMTHTCEHDGETIIGLCGYARGPSWTVERYVQKMWQPIPGVDLNVGAFGMAYVGLSGMVALNNAGTGAIYEIDAAQLLDPAVPPFAKPLTALVAGEARVTDMQGALVWDRFHPNTEWIYWQRILSNAEEGYFPIYRANVFSGEVQFVAESVYLFDHPSMTSALPSPFGLPVTTLVASNTQERNMALTNTLVTQSVLVAPSVVTQTRIGIPLDER